MQSKNIDLAENVKREVKFTNASLFYFQKEYGESFFQYVSKIGEGDHVPGHFDITYLVWAGLLHENKGLDLEQVMDLIDPSYVFRIWEDIQPLLIEAMPEMDEGKKQESQDPDKKKTSTSKSSKSKSSGQKKG